jgi:hypothetical protein
MLLIEHGGMWLDANSFFLGNLSWIDNLSEQELVYNKITSSPEVLTFTYNELMGGNKSTVLDDRTNSSVYLFPGIEIWAEISMPGAQFYKDVLETIKHVLSVGKEDADR